MSCADAGLALPNPQSPPDTSFPLLRRGFASDLRQEASGQTWRARHGTRRYFLAKRGDFSVSPGEVKHDYPSLLRRGDRVGDLPSGRVHRRVLRSCGRHPREHSEQVGHDLNEMMTCDLHPRVAGPVSAPSLTGAVEPRGTITRRPTNPDASRARKSPHPPSS